MRKIKSILFLAFVFTLCANAQQKPEEPDFNQLAETEADRLERILDLEVWQTFYVDSTLKHDYAAMMEELSALKDSKVSNSTMYVSIQDKWADKIDESYKKIFTQEQWSAYLKSGAARNKKAREKRQAKLK